MANKEVYRLSIKVGVTGDKKSKQKISDLEGATEKVEKKLKKLSDITASPSAKIKDKATSTIDKVESKVKKLSRATGTAKLQAKDSASVVVQKVMARTEQLNNKKIKPKIDVDDKASNKTKDIKEKVDELDKKKAKVKIEAEEQVTKTIEKADSKLKGWLKAGAKKIISLGVAGSLALGGIGIGSAMKTFTDFESAMSTVQATSMASAEDLTLLTEKAKEMGAKSVFSATESAEALNYMAMAGWKTDQMLGGIEGIMNLAAASGEDLAMTSDIVTDALTAFGMQASDSGKFADILAAASSNANTNVHLLGESFKYVAATAGAMKYNAEDTSIALGLMANAGIKGSMGGTALKNAIVNMVSPTDTMATVMDKYNLSLTDGEGNMKSLKSVIDMLRENMGGLDEATQAAAASQLFGKEAMSGMLSIINASQADYDKLTDAIYNSSGAADKMSATRLDNLKGQIEELSGAVETMKINLGERLAPYAKQFVSWLTTKIPVVEDKIVSTVDYISKHTDDIKSMAVAITGVVGAVTGVSAVGSIGNSISGISKFVSAIKIVKGANVAKETTKIAGGFDLIGIAAKALPALISPTGLAITAAVATTAYAVHSYNKLLKESVTTTTEELTFGEKVMNKLTGSVLKSKKELQEAGVIYDDFGEGISDDFKKAAQDASKSLLEIEMNIKRLNVDGVMDESDKHYFRQYVNEFAYEGINAMKEQKSKIESEFNKTFMLDGVVSETEQNVMDTLGKYFETGMNKQKELREKVYEIFDEAFVDHSKSVDQAMSEIKSKLEEMKSLELEYTKANNAYEQAYAQNQFKKDASKVISLDGASELMQKRAEEHNKQLDEIDNNYAGTLAYYDSLLSNPNLSNEERETFEKGKVEAETARNEAYAKAQEAWQSDLETLYQTFPGAKDKNGRSLLNEYTGEKLSAGDIKAQNRMDSMLNEYSGLNSVTESGVYSFTNSNGNLESFYVQVDETTKKITGLYETATQRAGGYTEEISNNMQNVMSEQETAVSQIMNNLANSQPHLDLATNTIQDYTGYTISELENVSVAADGTRTGIATINDTPLEIKTNADGVIESITLVNRTLDEINGKTVSATVNITQSSSIQQLNQEKLEMRKQQRGYASGTDYATSGIHEVAEHGVELVVGRQYRSFNGGEKVLNNGETKSFFKALGQTQVFQPQPQVQVVGAGGNSFGDINLNVNNGQNPEQLIEQACQEFARQLREALFNTK